MEMEKINFVTFVVLLFNVQILGAETLIYCKGARVSNLKDLRALRKCDVIEGNLIFGFSDAKSTGDWQSAGPLRVREVTGFVVFYFLDYLTSLDLILPHLRVIRGNTLYENYALIIYGLMDLKTIKLNNLSAIVRGSVFIRNNPWLNSYTHRILWNNITHWNNGRDITHMNVIQQIQGRVQMCNDSCRPKGSSVGFCWSRDVCQTVCPQSSSPLSCTASGDPCPEECIGGCNGTKCYACKHYRTSNGGCTESCFPHFSLDNYRCVTEKECVKLGRKVLYQKNHMCVEECPGYHKSDKSNSTFCPLCSDCQKNCRGSWVVDSVEQAHKLSGCTRINGSLEIRVYEKRIALELSKHLSQIQEVDGYVYVHHSRELKSLKFLGNLTQINGNDLWRNNYSLVVHDNEDLEELWNTTDNTLKMVKGLPLFYANPKLCTHTIVNLVGDQAWSKSVPDENIRRVLNGNKRACNVDASIDFEIEPLLEKGVLRLSINSEVIPGPYLIGFYVYYKETKKDTTEYYGTDWHWKRVFSRVPLKIPWTIRLKVKPATRYAIFLESKTTDPLNNFQSVIKYAVTKPFNPSIPERVKVSSSGLDYIEVTWDPPQFPNGIVDHYVISFQPTTFENYDDENMCNIEEKKKYIEYYNNEKEQQKQIAEEEEREESILRPGKSEASCPTQDSYVDETVDRKREHINMANKLSELIYVSDPYKVRKKRDVSDKIIEQVCLQIDRQSKRSVRKGIGRDLGNTSKNGSNAQPLITKDTLENYLQDKNTLFRFHQKLEEIMRTDPTALSTKCTIFLFDVIMRLEKNGSNKTDWNLNSRDVETDVNKPRFYTNFGNNSIIIFGRSYNITNITSSSYEFNITACQKQLNYSRDCGRRKASCKLCSPWYKARLDIRLDKEHYSSHVKIARIKENNVTVTWSPPKYLPMNEILYYTLYVQEIGNSSSARKNLHVYCESSSTNRSSFMVPKSGNYSITVAAFSAFNGELPASKPDTFVIINNHSNITGESHENNNGTKEVFIIMFSIIVFVLLSFVVYYFFERIKRPKKDQEKILNIIGAEFTKNPSYGDYPPWKEYLEKKIDKKYLYLSSSVSIEKCQVGEGNFGVVHKGILKDSKGGCSKVAFKKLRPEADGSSQSYRELIDEASLMLQLKSFHLVEMYGVAFENNELFLIMEYMENKSLSSYIKENCVNGDIFRLFTREKLLQLAVQIADGMAYLSHKHILHMDLAPRNCLLDDKLTAKISDFGMSRMVEGEYYRIRENKPVPVRIMPPEYFKYNKFTVQSDVWSYGVLLWQIMNPGKLPYENQSKNEDIKLEVLNNVLPGTISSKAPFGVIMAECWNTCPSQRPTFCRIVRDIHIKLTDKTFKNTFEKNSFYFNIECSHNMDFTDVTETEEPDDAPSTPLTNTPSLSRSHFLRGTSHHKSDNLESFRDRTSLRNWHRQLSSLQTSLSRSLTFVNNFKDTFSNSSNKISEITNKQPNKSPHLAKETFESQEDFSPVELKTGHFHKNGSVVIQI